ncbi:MAG: hypothetical protein D6732_26630 [Methanobacteriota archaeon]|nr:MAG: hypothetical protein D6732_26630 [Euryarchaeota archaeon]
MKKKTLEASQNKSAFICVNEGIRNRKKTVVILGVERGGTSMVAGMVRALGVDLGERAGRNHEDPKLLTDDLNRLKARIEEYNSRKLVWGFKIPKATLMLDFFDAHLRNPHYILVFRNIEAIVDSWCNRGADDPIASAMHALKYYGAALDFFARKKRPLAFVSYERGCDNPQELALAIANFLDLTYDEKVLERASSMVSGKGGGYLDLPEYYFHMEELALDASLQLYAKRVECKQRNVNSMAEINEKRPRDLIILEPKGKKFPETFLLEFVLNSKDSNFFPERGLRVYLDFTGEFFPGHAYRPVIHQGRNILRVTTNGNVRRIALGPFKTGYVFNISDVDVFEENSVIEKAGSFVISARQRASKGWVFRALSEIKRTLRLIHQPRQD